MSAVDVPFAATAMLCPTCETVPDCVVTDYESVLTGRTYMGIPVPGTERRVPTGMSTWTFTPCGHVVVLGYGDRIRTTTGWAAIT